MRVRIHTRRTVFLALRLILTVVLLLMVLIWSLLVLLRLLPDRTSCLSS